MTRQPFYSVSVRDYLRSEAVTTNTDRRQNEEPVRQWCAYELMRAYGIRIDEIEFERSVRVGSKTYRIDILVTRRGQPWLVVECKHPGYRRHPQATEQAISYADSRGVCAPWILYTNGHVWQAMTRLRGVWTAAPDIPCPPLDLPGLPLVELLRALRSLAPLLRNLGSEVKGAGAWELLESMQVFFNSGNLLTWCCDQQLLDSADNLLRAIISPNDNHYAFGKLCCSYQALQIYMDSTATGSILAQPHEPSPLSENFRYLHASLTHLLEGIQAASGPDTLLLRLILSLMELGSNLNRRMPKEFTIPKPVTLSLEAFIDASLSLHLNTRLPDVLDDIGVADVQRLCRECFNGASR